jgi:hypothetical protein
MTIQLTLKPRKLIDGKPQWHDRIQFDGAISTILAKTKKPGENFIWLSIAGKIEEKAQEIEFNKVIDDLKEINGENVVVGKKLNLPEFSIELSNMQAKLIWREFEKLIGEPMGFYTGLIQCPRCGNAIGTDKVLDVGLLSIMLQDIANQLGEKWIELSEEES